MSDVERVNEWRGAHLFENREAYDHQVDPAELRQELDAMKRAEADVKPELRESRRMPAPGQAISLTIPVSGLTYPNRFTIPGHGPTVYALTGGPTTRNTFKKDGTEAVLYTLPVEFEGQDPDPGDIEIYLYGDVQVEVIW